MSTTANSRRESAPPTSTNTSANRPSSTRLYTARNDLPEATRLEVIGLLNQRLAECIDLETQCKQAHWNVKGPTFIALHKLFDEIHAAVGNYSDLLAERVVQLGGVAEGTVSVITERLSLVDYPLTIAAGNEHATALADALATFGRAARIGIEEMNDLQDADSADILTEISRGIDQWLWFVEAHLQGA
jgi:starvation-inducible DNA-binding protein